MQYYFAPMEGVTSAVYRRTHREYFPGVDKYFMPFITPTAQERLTPRQKRDVAPEANAGVPAVPQLLTKNAADFIWCANALAALGYGEVNLNLGCPSGTVTAKGKGAGFLADPEALDRFFDAVFAACAVKISVKTRLGVRDPAEFDRLLAVYNRYPIAELTIHPRVRQDFYKGRVREAEFAAALPRCRMPVCYNGDVVCQADARAVETRCPALSALMLGRGLIADPSLVTRLRGGARADKRTLEAFHNALYGRYCDAFGDRRIAMLRMKEIWFYHINLFADSERHGKALRKSGDPRAYEAAAAAVFRDLDLLDDAVPGWFRPA
ncbi:MAG: tRNA-dihydrouridine synthase family protein [Eubacteriales bacterium]|nr:tRNA-dihydrouridine synthase family protein [Eubacteriales bacterium]